MLSFTIIHPPQPKNQHIQPMVSFESVLSLTYHTKQLNPWPTSPTSRISIYSQLPAVQVKYETI